jgi:membrane protein DedA with SNARE-associated domain
LEHLRLLIEQVISTLGYPGMALVMLVENLFPPIPSELVVPFAGFLVSRGEMTMPAVLLAATCGTVLGAMVLYALGSWLGEGRVRLLFRHYGRYSLLSERDFDRALELFRRYDRPVVFWARLVPGVRSLISVPAGVVRMPLGRFLLFTTLGTLLWNALLAYAGMLLGQNWPLVLSFVDHYELALWLLAGGAAAAWSVRWLVRKRERKGQGSAG